MSSLHPSQAKLRFKPFLEFKQQSRMSYQQLYEHWTSYTCIYKLLRKQSETPPRFFKHLCHKKDSWTSKFWFGFPWQLAPVNRGSMVLCHGPHGSLANHLHRNVVCWNDMQPWNDVKPDISLCWIGFSQNLSSKVAPTDAQRGFYQTITS